MQTAGADFTSAPDIFPNNYVKYDVKKRRAKTVASTHIQASAGCAAKDRPSTEVLNEEPCIMEGNGDVAPAA